MSLITRCPSCGTQFKLVPDQLKVSHGWVRCGHCAEVFDASQRLENVSPPARPVPVVAAETQRDATDSVAEQQENTLATDVFFTDSGHPESTDIDSVSDTERSPLLETTPAALRPQPQEVSASTFASFADELNALAERSNAKSAWPDELGSSRFDVESVVEWSDSKPQIPGASSVGNRPDTADEMQQVSFVRQARRKALWRHPAVRLLLSLLGLGLTGLLGVQFAVHERDRLALTQPALRPYLQPLCQWAGCEIRPLRQIESIAIDSSSFNKAWQDSRQETYRLSFVLKNNAALPLAVPALELTLTDTLDRPVLRRTLMPTEFGARADIMAGGGELASSIAIGISLAEGLVPPGRVAGYRLLAYYP